MSPDNIRRAKQGRQVKKLQGGWLAAEDSGTCHLITTHTMMTVKSLSTAIIDTVGSNDDYHATSDCQFGTFSFCITYKNR